MKTLTFDWGFVYHAGFHEKAQELGLGLQRVFIKGRPKTEDRRPKIKNEDEYAYNHNSIQSRFLTSSANRPLKVLWRRGVIL